MANVFNSDENEPRNDDEAGAPSAWVWSHYRGEFPNEESEPQAGAQTAQDTRDVKPKWESHSDEISHAIVPERRVEEALLVVEPMQVTPAKNAGARSHALIGPLVMIAIIIAGGLAWHFVGAPNSSDKAIPAPKEETPSPVLGEASGTTETKAPAESETATSSDIVPGGNDPAPVQSAADAHKGVMTISLPNGASLSVPESGVENKLFVFLEQGPNGAAEFDLDRISFDAAKATLTSSSQEQLQNLAQILNAFPQAKVIISAYADDGGNRVQNSKLSLARANGVLGELKRIGVGKSRLTAKGHKESRPLAPNNASGAQVSLGVKRE
jgi:outer membrane protein OmpA-like peptidoglycan-associated protein